MTSYQYLIVGAGMTADAAAKGIREVDRDGTIGIIGSEVHRPYDRPPLSKGLWTGKPEEKIWRGPLPPHVNLVLGRTVGEIDRTGRQVIDDAGESHSYEKLLLATGGAPRRLPFADDERIIYFRTLEDYRRLRSLADTGERFAVIGGGFIGSEIAAALAMNGKQVVVAFPGQGIGHKVYPQSLSQFINQYYREKGVELLPRHTPVSVEARGGQLALSVEERESGKRTEELVDGIVAGIGIEPNTALAEAAGLEVGDGILVDARLRTSDPNIHAAGDVAAAYIPALGRRMRIEHEDNANTMGRMAGRSMAGAEVEYTHLSYFYSDLFDLGYEAVGELDARLQTVEQWEEPFRKGVVYYLGDGRVRGVLLWNVWDQVEAARRLIEEPGPFGPDDVKGRLPE
jgi:3-phenylpropionate/trans-cinnamate dioxygenase ferredoxin reductase subunit